ncbi:alpha/beta-hydrolase [Exidia glandulosa HHB12029]|uniref:Carboxypeptidase n=1 Tax=Exidia glandulosa HHB12029 TaxID=1314781 RepID=A0A165DJ43_EXIGL|nr:alpha/beta-hydrolase [Exidia glandulosa HHB12029]
MRTSTSALLLAAFLGVAVHASQQQVLHGGPAVLGFNEFTTLKHPLYPAHAVRVKKTKHCDGEVNTYSGYVDNEAKHLWFEFFESRSDPAADDVVFWTNGGPGCSSAVGLYMEHGPCLILDEKGPKRNPYSWNENANVLYIHQPINVGFSYAEHGEVVWTTEEAALDVAAFISILFDSEHFEHLNLTAPGRKLHMTGESYGGRYIPLFASAILDQNVHRVQAGHEPITVSSIMLGNGVVDWAPLMTGFYEMQCTSAPGVMPTTPISTCVRMRQALPRCLKGLQSMCIDVLDQMGCLASWNFCAAEMMEPYASAGRNVYDVTKQCEATDDDETCYAQSMHFIRYLSLNSTQEELGVDPGVRGPFKSCSRAAGMRFNDSGDFFRGSYDYIASLLERGVRVLAFNGAYDFICNWAGTQRWTDALEWSGSDAYRATKLQDWEVDGQSAGKWRGAGGLTFATIHAAGHMAPFDKPKESLVLLQRWLENGKF